LFFTCLSYGRDIKFPSSEREGMFQGIEREGEKKNPQVGLPIKLLKTPGAYSLPPPRMGQDSRSVLQKGGFGMEEIKLLEEEGIICTTQREGKTS
jgi:crotonobetainyl-CoA:carnitine CoA-transferase CaiB-like acyl-CoA transferase